MKYFITNLVILFAIQLAHAKNCNETSIIYTSAVNQTATITPNKIQFSEISLSHILFFAKNHPSLSSKSIYNLFIPASNTYKSYLIFILPAVIALILLLLFLIHYSITKHKKELLVLDSEKRLKLALNSANEGLWDVIPHEKRFIYNDELAKLLGFNSHEDMNLNLSNWRSFLHTDDISQFKESLLLHIKGFTESFNCEARFILKDGNYKWFGLHGKITERTSTEKPNRITGIIIDISEQKEFEHQLKLAKEKAEENDKLKSSFLANTSHEIRTPLNAIIGFSDILLSHQLPAYENEKYLQLIKTSGENLLNIINDVIDFSKIESGQLSFINEKFNLNNLLNKISETAHSLIKSKNKNIQFFINIPDNTEKTIVYTDPFRLEQILLNLVSNAIKFTNKGNVTLSFGCINSKIVKFIITDTGIGIAPKELDTIFLRFIQANNAKNNRTQGSGLGLTITKSLVKMMGGEINVTSELNKGTQFTITLPIHPIIEKKVSVETILL
jgi:PAS domain S-box-containing protein